MVMLMPLSFDRTGNRGRSSVRLWSSSPSRETSLIFTSRPNPFRSLADNVVPAVVLFSILLGVALMSVKENAPLLRGLGIAAEALSRVTKLSCDSPRIGLFAIVASACGAP